MLKDGSLPFRVIGEFTDPRETAMVSVGQFLSRFTWNVTEMGNTAGTLPSGFVIWPTTTRLLLRETVVGKRTGTVEICPVSSAAMSFGTVSVVLTAVATSAAGGGDFRFGQHWLN
jgi:hypothetical protein